MTAVLAAVARVVALLSWSALERAGAVLGWLAGSVLRIRRAAVEAAMARAGVASPGASASAMYRGLGAGVFELLWLAGVPATRRERALRDHVKLDDDLERTLLESAERGPVVLAASHTGNWELIAYGAAQVLAKHGRSLAVVVKPQSVGAFHAFCTDLRTACGLELIAPTGALRAARRTLAAGNVLAMPIDQVPDRQRHAVDVSFLDATAFADRAPAALARATGATLLVVAASRRGGVHRGHLLAELAPSGPKTHDAVATATRDATRALEAFVRDEPASWLWLHRRWRAPLERATATSGTTGKAAPATSGPLVVTGHPG